MIFAPGRWIASTVTLLNAATILAFLGGNALLAALTIRGGLATIAVVNLVPFFWGGGRTSILIDFLGIPRHVHQLAQYWIGWVMVLQATLHGVVSFTKLSDPSKTIGIGSVVILVVIPYTLLLPIQL